MPVILDPDEEMTWLSTSDVERVASVLDPYLDDRMAEYEVSTPVNNPAMDSPKLVDPAGGEQFELGEFG